MKRFTIDEEHLCSVTEQKTWYVCKDPNNPTPEELVEMLQGKATRSMLSTKDHPSFTELREELGREGYIFINRKWWNGDMVLKQFRLNGYLFKKDEIFVCASAMGGYLSSAAKHRPYRFK